MIYEEEDIALLAVGNMVKIAEQVRKNLKEIGYSCTLVNARFVKPIDTEVLDMLSADHKLLVTMEENVRSGGYGEKCHGLCGGTGTSGEASEHFSA